MGELKPVAVVKPGLLSAKDKERLTKAGYCVIESDDLECIKIIHHVAFPMSDTMVFHAAMSTLGDGYSGSTFGTRLAKLAADASAPVAARTPAQQKEPQA